MGAWGTSLFSDDAACDVRDDYLELLRDLVPDEEAQSRVLEQHLEGDEEGDATVWLALAATQFKSGRLDADVKEKAIEVIDAGVGLELWEDEGPKMLAKRRAVLSELRAQLTGPQPARKIFRKLNGHVTSLRSGDVLAYRVHNRCLLFLVNEIDVTRQNTAPVLDALSGEWTNTPNRLLLWLMIRNKLNDTYHGRYEGPPWMPKRQRVHTKGGLDYLDAGFELVHRKWRTIDVGFTGPHGRTNWQVLAESLDHYFSATEGE